MNDQKQIHYRVPLIKEIKTYVTQKSYFRAKNDKQIVALHK